MKDEGGSQQQKECKDYFILPPAAFILVVQPFTSTFSTSKMMRVGTGRPETVAG